MSLLLDRHFRAASLSHLAVDLLNAQRPVLLAVLSVPLGLTNALIGLISMVYTFAASLSQPALGVLSDRYGPCRIAAVGVLWRGLMLSSLTGASHSILIAYAQRLMPGRLGAASGLALGFTFAAGSLGTWLSGYQADLAGFDAVFLSTASLSLLAGGVSLGLTLD